MCEPVIDDEVRAAARDFKAELQAIYGPKLRGVYLRPHEMVEGVRVADVVIVLDEPGGTVGEIIRTNPAVVHVESVHNLVIKTTFVPTDRWETGGSLPGRNPSRQDLVAA